MKYFFKKIISILNKFILIFNSASFKLLGNIFYLVRINSTKNNVLSFQHAEFSKSIIQVSGTDNLISVTNALISNSSINVAGSNNKIVLHDGVKLNGADIIVRGNYCSISIGKNTSFGGIKIINVGENCAITIGENCMFSDNVELWASDTHPIYNDKHEVINHEAPITLGDKVWVGSHVIILKGVSVGDGAVIGMRSLVTKDVPCNVISVGNPNRVIKENISWSLKYRDKL